MSYYLLMKIGRGINIFGIDIITDDSNYWDMPLFYIKLHTIFSINARPQEMLSTNEFCIIGFDQFSVKLQTKDIWLIKKC